MKQTRTTLKALTAAYRAVLRHGILCNAIALGLIATAPAMADRLVVDEAQTLTDQIFTGNSAQAVATSEEVWTEPTLSMLKQKLWASPDTDPANPEYLYEEDGVTIKKAKIYTKYKNTITTATGGEGAAIYNNSNGLTINGGEVSHNTSTGALAPLSSDNIESSDKYRIQDGWEDYVFESHTGYSMVTKGADGAGLYNASGAEATINDTLFSNNSSATDGGAIYSAGTLTLNKANFTSNRANTGAAVYSIGALSIDGGEYSSNTTTSNGGAVYLKNGRIDNAIFTENTGRSGGAVNISQSSGGSPVNISNSTFKNNNASGTSSGSGLGGAINTVATPTLNITKSLFEGNIAGTQGGAIYAVGVTTITDTSFKDNTASSLGGAIFRSGNKALTINADQRDVVFSGNKANGVANDISASASYTLNLNANEGKAISMDGGIVGKDENNKTTININSDSTINGGTVAIANAIKYATVTHNNGELHLNNVDLTGSTVTVASGATLNSIDEVANDYSDFITLTNGARFALDADFNDGGAYDKYTIADGANVAITQLNLLRELSNGGVAPRSLQIAQQGNIDVSAVADTVQAYTSTATFGLVGNTANDGTISLVQTATDGGLSLATDATATKDVVFYNVTADDDSVTTDKLVASELSVIGGGITDGDAKVTLGATLSVDDDATLTITDTKVADAGSGAIDNREGGLLTIMNSRIGVNVNNAGTLISDPTYYGAEVVNTGTASFTGDVFENGSSLTNSAIVNLNNVEFKSGSSLIGNAGNTLNLVGTGNIFNGSSTGNNVVLASGANYTGTLYDGVVDARNGGIDTITGSVSGGDLYVDANLTSGEVDTFGGTSGATIKSIKLANAGYGTEDKVELTIGEATLANDLSIDGINYYTSVVKDGDNIVFSDKLINESNLYNKLGSWTGGNYIASSANMENAADGENYMTVGQALSALDTNLKTVSTAGTIDAGQTGFVTGDAVYNAFASQTASAVDLHDAIEAIMATNASANAKRAALGQLLMTGTVAGQTLTAYTTAEAMTSLVTLTGEAMSQYDFGWDINAGLQNDLDDEGKYKIDVLNDSNVEDKTVAGAINANTSAISANAEAIATLNGTGEGSVSQSISDALTAAVADGGVVDTAIDNALTAALGENGAVTSAINTALEDYSTTEEMNTAINDALNNAVADGGVVDTAIDNAITAAVSENGAVATAINNATTMGSDDDDSASMYAHFDEGASVIEAATALDTALSATESDIATLNGDENEAGSVKNTAKGYADTAETNAKNFATSAVDSLANGAVAENTAALSLLNGDEGTEGSVAYAAANAVATANAYTDSKLNEVRDSAVAASNAYTDRRIEDLDKNLSAGVAGAVALSSVAVSGVERGEVSVGAGYGYFNGQSAAAFGATMGLSNRWSVNAGAGISNADVSFRAGTNYKFKLF